MISTLLTLAQLTFFLLNKINPQKDNVTRSHLFLQIMVVINDVSSPENSVTPEIPSNAFANWSQFTILQLLSKSTSFCLGASKLEF